MIKSIFVFIHMVGVRFSSAPFGVCTPVKRNPLLDSVFLLEEKKNISLLTQGKVVSPCDFYFIGLNFKDYKIHQIKYVKFIQSVDI